MYERPSDSLSIEKRPVNWGATTHVAKLVAHQRGDNKCPEHVYLKTNSDRFLDDVADSFSLDVTGFEFRNNPFMERMER